MDSIFGLLQAARKHLAQALQPILFRQTLLTFWNTSYAQALEVIKRIQTWSALAYQRMLNKIKKTFKGRPTQIFVERLAGSTQVTLWPVPDGNETYTLFYYRLEGTDGLSSGISGTTTNFIPPRWVPCLVAGLAYQVSMKKAGSEQRAAALKEEYEFQYQLAAGEDADRVSVRFVPFNSAFVEG